MSLLTSAQEEVAQPMGDGFFSKGKTLISTKEGGLFEPSPNDEIAVAPGIGDMINKPSQTVVNNDNSAVVSAVNTLNATMQGVSTGISDLKNKQSVVNLNGQFIEKFGTAQNLTNYNLA
jgi:hypothetical protein